MAHELMHAWLHIRGFTNPELPKKVKEGLCQLMSYLWLQSQDSKVMVRKPGKPHDSFGIRLISSVLSSQNVQLARWCTRKWYFSIAV
jgi:hypothetical protein